MANGAIPAALMVFILGVVCATALYRALFGHGRLRDERLLEPGYGRGETAVALLRGPAAPGGFGAGLLAALTRRFANRTSLTPGQRRVAATLTHAGFHGLDKLILFRLLQLAAMAAAGGAGAYCGAAAAKGHLALPLALLGAALGYVLPIRILGRIARQRQVRIIRELPAALDLLVVCLEAGLGLDEAFRQTTRRAHRRGEALGRELAVMTGEVNAGVALIDALRNMAERSGTEELKSVAALLIQSHQMGTRLAPALRASAEQFAIRRRMRAEERAQKAAVKMLVPLVILILPAMLIVVLGPAFLQIIAVVAK